MKIKFLRNKKEQQRKEVSLQDAIALNMFSLRRFAPYVKSGRGCFLKKI